MPEPAPQPSLLSPLKRALLAIEELQAKLAASESARSEPIAIIGLGCRFPGEADTPAAFWDLLAAGVDAVTEVPPGRWPVDAFYAADPSTPGRMTARHGGFLRDLESFDPAYFGISPREAASMDPQHRLLLEVAWEALSAAGQRRERLAGSSTGVFVGITSVEYGALQLAVQGMETLDTYHLTGNALNAAAGRLAFVFGLHGPCLAVDTACSSSLVALHLACQSLRAGECETALAGGVNAILSPLGSIALSQGRVLSSTGRAKAFAADADGMVRGEGCGLLVLKRLSAAQRDGDRVLAVIRGSGVNQDGPSSGLTVPNGPAQELLLRQVLAGARVDPGEVDYVEAHGTGTALGDPIEVGALGAVYGAGRAPERPLWIGSVKTNFGHLESAAGIAGVIKAVLALHHEAIPPHLHFAQPSPHIDWTRWALRVPTALTPWPRGPRPRYAGVSAFGFSGTNAHLLLAEAPMAVAPGDQRGLSCPPPPFQRVVFPLPRPAHYGGVPVAPGAHPLLGAEVALAGTNERRFEAGLSASAPAWLADHQVFAAAVMPAAGWLEMALAAGREALGTDRVAVHDFSLREALVLSAGAATIQTVVTPASEEAGEVRLYVRSGDGWTLHGEGRVALAPSEPAAPESLAVLRARCAEPRDVTALYAAYESAGLSYGPAFRGVRALWVGREETLAELHLPTAAGAREAYALHPALLDACFQSAGAAFAPSEAVFLPVEAARWVWLSPPGDTLWCHARVRTAASEALLDLQILNPDGRLVARLDGLVLRRATPQALRRIVTPETDGWYEITWSPAPIALRDRPAEVAGDWLVIKDRQGVGPELAKRLRQAGATVTAIEPEDLAPTLARAPRWRRVVHLGGLDVASETPPTAEGVGLDAGLTLARSLATAEGVWLVTRGAVPCAGSRVVPAAAAWWGWARVLAQEHPDWSLRLVDVESGLLAVEALLAECLEPGTENQLAWREGVRHAARLTRWAGTETEAPALSPAASYLVTGGWGALGLLAADWLVERGARHLVLAGRRAPTAAAEAQIALWRQAGVTVETCAVDLAVPAEVAALLANRPTLRGIVHAAGAVADGMAQHLTLAQCSQVLGPKALGAWHLHQRAGELDFLVLFSSAAAVLGTAGQANYAAANAYLDGLAHARRAQGQPALSVNWGPWTVGLAAGWGERYASRGVGAITPARGREELLRLGKTSSAQVAVMPMDWPRVFAAFPAGGHPPLLSALAPRPVASRRRPAPVDDFAPRWAGASPTERLALATEWVQREVARVLQLEPGKLPLDRPLAGLGLDSIMAVDLRHRVRRALDVEIPLVDFLTEATVESLAATVVRLAPRPSAAPASERVPAEWPLSIGQEALWFWHQAAPASPAYHTAVALRWRGPRDEIALRRALAALIDRHPLWRATFAEKAGRPQMVIASAAPLAWTTVLAAGWSEDELSQRVAEEYQRPYDLARGPLFRATLYQISPDDAVLLIGVHHIVGDAWSNWLLLDEFRRLYTAERAGRPAALPSMTGTYLDFVRWQRALLAGPEGERLEQFWRRELAGELPPLALPTDGPRPPVWAPRGASAPLTLSPATWEGLRALARAQRTTPFAVLLAAFQVFLHRYSGQRDFVVGSPTAGRSQPEFAGVAGYFVNPVPLRARLTPGQRFSDFLAQTRRTVLAALAHADYPLPTLVERLSLPRDPSRPALFQTLFVYQQPPQTGREGEALRAQGMATAVGEDVEVTEFPLAQMEGQFELALELFEGGGGRLKYHSDLFAPATIARWVCSLQTLLAGILAQPDRRIDDLPLLPEEERESVVRTWNDTPAAYPQEPTLTDLLAAQAARSPEAIAVWTETGTLTYRALEARANQLARWLQRAGVGPDALVGVCAERSLELVVALVGILKAGGAYVPLDPAYPRERLRFMQADAAVGWVLTSAAWAELWEDSGVPVLRLDADWPQVAAEAETAPTAGITPDHLAYMIYTSGSTGQPKGALNTHRAIVNRLLWMQDAYRLTPADVVMQKTPFSFDVSVWEFFWPLLTGARLVMARPGGHQDAAYLADLAAEQAVTTLHFVPSMLQRWVEVPALERCRALRQVFCSGEALPAALQERFFARHGAALHNLYGPTEAAVDVTFWPCERDGARPIVPIGRPIARTQIYVLDPRGQPTPIGVAGELFIGGIGLARGYHRRPDLTAEKFVPNPFGPPGSRLYRTGDLARWLPDGVLEYLGRLDHQVKLRGFRIELGEIEAALERLSEVSAAVVVMRADAQGEPQLVAYVAGPEGTPERLGAWRRTLRAHLPEYMVPGDWVVLPALPLSPNGKVDRRALPAPSRQRPALAASYTPPATATERMLAALWSELLGREGVGIDDNFFDLGGHSLRLGQVQARLAALFASPPSLLELFQYPTIRALAARLEADGALAVTVPLAPAPAEGPGERRRERRDGLLDQRALRRAAREGRLVS